MLVLHGGRFVVDEAAGERVCCKAGDGGDVEEEVLTRGPFNLVCGGVCEANGCSAEKLCVCVAWRGLIRTLSPEKVRGNP